MELSATVALSLVTGLVAPPVDVESGVAVVDTLRVNAGATESVAAVIESALAELPAESFTSPTNETLGLASGSSAVSNVKNTASESPLNTSAAVTVPPATVKSVASTVVVSNAPSNCSLREVLLVFVTVLSVLSVVVLVVSHHGPTTAAVKLGIVRSTVILYP